MSLKIYFWAGWWRFKIRMALPTLLPNIRAPKPTNDKSIAMYLGYGSAAALDMGFKKTRVPLHPVDEWVRHYKRLKSIFGNPKTNRL